MVMTNEEYTKRYLKGESPCPACGGGNSSFSYSGYNSNTYWECHTCIICKASWTIDYEFTGYSSLEQQKGKRNKGEVNDNNSKS